VAREERESCRFALARVDAFPPPSLEAPPSARALKGHGTHAGGPSPAGIVRAPPLTVIVGPRSTPFARRSCRNGRDDAVPAAALSGGVGPTRPVPSAFRSIPDLRLRHRRAEHGHPARARSACAGVLLVDLSWPPDSHLGAAGLEGRPNQTRNRVGYKGPLSRRSVHLPVPTAVARFSRKAVNPSRRHPVARHFARRRSSMQRPPRVDIVLRGERRTKAQPHGCLGLLSQGPRPAAPRRSSSPCANHAFDQAGGGPSSASNFSA